VSDQAASAGVTGPVPPGRDPEEYDRLRRRVLWALPSGLYLVGSAGELGAGPRWNLMTANLVAQVAVVPKLVAVAVDVEAVTCELVEAGGAFAVSLLDRGDRTVVRRFVKPVVDVELDDRGRPRTLAGEAVRFGPTGCPIVERAAAWLDCEVRHRLPLGSHVLFVGEVVDAGERPGEPPGGVLRMEDTRMNYGG
jgi:flavin reductase (DIM6/NTAB) family NADH-FMN oxidoreductase RutF